MAEENKGEITYRQIKKNEEINLLIERGNQVLNILGFTEHSKKHAAKVAETAGKILKDLGYGEKEIRLSKIAGYMHDIGNSINRHDHAHTGALLAYGILKDLGMPLEDVLTVTTAIGNHDESTGTAVDVVSAALILADKTELTALEVSGATQYIQGNNRDALTFIFPASESGEFPLCASAGFTDVIPRI